MVGDMRLRSILGLMRFLAVGCALASICVAEAVPDVAKAVPDDVEREPDAAERSARAGDSQKERAVFLGGPVKRGLFEYRYWSSGQSLDGLSVPAPVLIVAGEKPGPMLCLTGAVHGDELNGVEIIRRVLFGLDPEEVNGTLIGVPIVNLHGFRRNSRYLADRRDLNRFFPGDPNGSSASRIAYSLFTEVIRHCDYLVDIHTGSFHRTNLAHIRADLRKPSVLKIARQFGDISVLHHPGAAGTLRRAAAEVGVAAVTLEVGEPLRLQPDEVKVGVRGIEALLVGLGMLVRPERKHREQAIYYESTWLRADAGGILLAKVELGDDVSRGQVLGTVTDPITNRRSSISSSADGRILGMAINQVVMPGFAAFHLGREPRGERRTAILRVDPPRMLDRTTTKGWTRRTAAGDPPTTSPTITRSENILAPHQRGRDGDRYS